jgi:hypothetical protein
VTPEGAIKKNIMAWLNAQPGCYARILQIAGFRGRKNVSAGMADIIGAFKGWALAIEVKTPEGTLSDEQQAFLACWTQRGGGIGIVARGLDDVIQVLKRVEER